MPEKHKPKSTDSQSSLVTWGPAAAIIVVIAVYFLSQIMAAIILSIYPGLKHWSSAEAQNWLSNSNYAQFFYTLIVEGLSLVLLGLFLKYRKTDFKSLGLKDHPRLTDLGYMLLGLAMYLATYFFFVLVLEKLVPSFNVNQKQDLGFSGNTTGNQLWLVFVSLVILPPIIEEILFRGFLYTGLRTKMHKITAALITSLLFCLPHLLEGSFGILWVAGLDTFILSLVLVYLREKTDKLWAPMGLHLSKNFLAFAFLFLFHVT